MTRNVDATIESFRPLIRRTVERFHHETALARAVAMVVRALVDASRCSDAEHRASMIRRPAVLVPADGSTDATVALRCPLCSTVLHIPIAEALAASAPIRAVRRRRDTPVTLVQPAMTMQELNDEARARLRL